MNMVYNSMKNTDICDVFMNPEVKHFCPDVPVILVGNKKDLRNDDHIKARLAQNKQFPVKPEAGQNMADSIGAVTYRECSAKTREGVVDIFESAVRAAQTSQKKKKKPLCNIL